MPPTIYGVPHPQHFEFDDRTANFLSAGTCARQEHLPHRNQLVLMRLMPGPADLIEYEADGKLHMDARAIACLAVRIDGTAAPYSLQRVDTRLHRDGYH